MKEQTLTTSLVCNVFGNKKNDSHALICFVVILTELLHESVYALQQMLQ